MSIRRRPAASAASSAAASVLRRPAAVAVAVLAPPQPSGPVEERGSRQGIARRQYCWWITFSYPYASTVQQHGLRTPANFTRQTFLDLCRECHQGAGVALVEVVIFLEKHQRVDDEGNRLPRLNALTKASSQHAWKRVAQLFYERSLARVDFAQHIRTWYDGVVY